MIELKGRLAEIAGYVPQGSTVIDVGTDHAYLPIFLVQRGRCPRAVGVDIHAGPYRSAVEQVRLQGLPDRIRVCQGDGLQPVEPGEGDVVVVAGMGGTTIVDILQAGERVLAQVNRLILQPMVAGSSLRLWLLQHGWAIRDEKLVEEDGRIYEIGVAERGVQPIPSEIMLELGPCIVAKKDPLLPRLVDSRVEALKTVLAELDKARRPGLEVKQAEIRNKIRLLQEVLA